MQPNRKCLAEPRQKVPKPAFSVFIRKRELINFSSDPQAEFDGQLIAVKGKVQDFNGTPTINLAREERIDLYGN
ncbi:hypothetical protein QWY85_13900 [Neolewinella lacunae]|uniref:Uncharacterized protein n=1 Tax=Neolewinella lacunae TaxID=1517758 RepID=A0A923PQI0_9BACT|nr:hypothetical protein [Neolewinella lacunae]MBC6994897.1 hypothetical protein [Neolewinella lacunae]MDN3635758.1 hypothetical protein [Neolewinella lacunae]